MAMFGRATRNDVLRSYMPTMAERIPIAVQGFLGRLGLNKYQARSFGQPIADVLGYSPIGAVAQSWDAGQSAARAPGMFGKAGALGGGMALAALGAVPGGKALRGAERIFYRGTNGSAERIAGGIGEGLLFASPQERIAKLYGDNIEKIAAKPEAKILRESSRDFARLIGRKTGGLYSAMRPGESVHSLSNDAIAKAREAGYDAVDFDKTTDVGTAIINEAAFIRNHGKPPLAMDEASRMARAAEQGFTVDAYHGTTNSFDAFDPSRTRDIGMHFGTPGQASKITQNWNGHQMTDANIMPVKLAVNNPLRVADDFDRQSRRHIGIAKSITLDTPGFRANASEREAIYAAAKNADKLKAKARKKYAIIPMSEDVGEQAFWAEIQKSAERQGYDGLVYANKIEGKGDSHVVFDPANIRSKFAAFDPAKRGSANLLAGVGAGAMLAPSMFGNRGGER